MPPPKPSPTVQQLRSLDAKIWRACAGTSLQIPELNSRVYYFPQGHLEQACSPPPCLSHHLLSRPIIPCRIASVNFLADPVTDEVFAKLLLYPLAGYSKHARDHRDDISAETQEDDKVVSFAKILTPSDANNGGGFSVPRFCADLIFPPLDYETDPPVQTLSITDLRGNVWEFRHIYRGTPRRHLLTTGWSKFVNHKKLVSRDSVVFMRNTKGEMFVGVRRAVKFNTANTDGDGARWMRAKVEGEEDCREGFSRNGRGKLSVKAVVEAAESAAQDMPFEVVYYPRVGWSDFVVKAEAVEEALNRSWAPGTRVKMSMETEDSSRVSWFQGTVYSVSVPENGPWQNSPWRMLQVTWDEPEVLHNSKRVNPWQVDYVSPSSPLHASLPPAKKLRVPRGFGLQTDGEGGPSLPLIAVTNSTVGHFNQSLLNYETFPAGMQGARHNLFCVSSLSNFLRENTSHLSADNSFGNNMVPKLKAVSTELNIGGSQSDNLSPDSQSSVHSIGSEVVGTQRCNTKKLGDGSFLLFGKIIRIKQPDESGSRGGICCKVGESKGYNETEGRENLSNLSTYSKFLDRLDVPCQRSSVIEACYL